MQPTKRPAAVLTLLTILLMMLAGSVAAGQPDEPATCSELLINGGFEAGPAGWTQSSADGFDLISQFNPRNGAWGAYLAGYNAADDQLQQTLTLPAGATATLRAWWMLETEEPALPNDSLTLSLLRPDGTTLSDLWSTDNTAPAGLWDEAVIDLTRYVGQPVTLQLHAATNAYDLTDFYLDDMSVQVCVSANATLRSYLPLVIRS